MRVLTAVSAVTAQHSSNLAYIVVPLMLLFVIAMAVVTLVMRRHSSNQQHQVRGN